MNPPPDAAPRLSRRDALKWISAAAASSLAFSPDLRAGVPAARGYGTDPDLQRAYAPGDVWPLTFSPAQRAAAAALCGLIVPPDAEGPGAEALLVHDFIDEWISAPYPGHDADRKIVTEGLAWLDAEARRRWGGDFVRGTPAQRAALAEDVCDLASAKPELRAGARFFQRFRDLTAGGYFTTPEGMKDLGYTGNYAMEAFTGPPPEVLRRLGLA